MRAILVAALLVSLRPASAADLPPFPVRVHWAQDADVAVVVAGPRALSVIKLDGTVLSNMTAEADVLGLDLTRAGNIIAFATENTLTIVGSDGVKKATLDARRCSNLRWSNDGSKLFFTTFDPGATGSLGQMVANVVNADGSNRRQLFARAYTATGMQVP